MTRRETAMKALFALVQQAGSVNTDMHIKRNWPWVEDLPEETSAMLNLLDGSLTVLGETLGQDEDDDSQAFEIQHTARLEILVSLNDREGEDRFDDIINSITLALREDRTLNGTVDWARTLQPEDPSEMTMSFAVGFKISTLPIELTYTAPTAAG